MKRIILFIAVFLIFVAMASANRTRAIAALPPFETGSDCLDPNVRKPQTISLGRIASRVIDIPRPDYPVEARRQRLQGTGLYALHILPSGAVASVDVVRSTGSPILDQAAVFALRRWVYRQKPAGRVITVPMTFHLHS